MGDLPHKVTRLPIPAVGPRILVRSATRQVIAPFEHSS